MFHITYDKENGWTWWYGRNGSYGPDAVNMGWFRSKDDCIAEIKNLKKFLPLANIDDPSPPKSPPFSQPGFRPNNL